MADSMINRIRKKLYVIIFQSDTKSGRLFDVIFLWLVLLSILSVFLESVTEIRNNYAHIIHFAEWFFTVVFTLEYVLRTFSSENRWKYIFSFYGIIDIVALLPSYLSLLVGGVQYFLVIRAFRLLRVFRILKLTRYLTEGNVLTSALKASRYKIIVFLSSVITLVIIVGTLMYIIEGNSSGFTRIPRSIYWAIVTITTVGYGDISPKSPLGQFLASVLMIIGYGIIAVPTGIVSAEIARATDGGKAKCPVCYQPIVPDNARFCYNCGNRLHEN